jgi:hypothetical protein
MIAVTLLAATVFAVGERGQSLDFDAAPSADVHRSARAVAWADYFRRPCCVVRPPDMPRAAGGRADQIAGLSSSNAVASLKTGGASTASS